MKAVNYCISCLMVLALLCGVGCSGGNSIREALNLKKPGAYNFKFVGYDINVTNPEMDRRSYYKIYLDKIEVGRTGIGLESQDKVFEATIEPNRHLLTVEKWVLDEKNTKYIKVNNIEQPRPNYVYFGINAGRIVVITLKNDRLDNKAVFEVDFEYD